MENKKKKQTKQTDRRIRGVIAVLVILILGVTYMGSASDRRILQNKYPGTVAYVSQHRTGTWTD